MLFLLSIVISTNKTEAAVQDTNEGTSNVQWEDENFGESICNALKKEEVTYADIEGITGISIDSQYVVKLDWKDKTEEYVYNSGNDMCEILALQEFSTLEDGVVTKVIDSNSFETIECNIFGAPCKIIAMTRQKSDVRGIVRSTKARR